MKDEYEKRREDFLNQWNILSFLVQYIFKAFILIAFYFYINLFEFKHRWKYKVHREEQIKLFIFLRLNINYLLHTVVIL